LLDLSVVIPTRDRRAVLLETLRRLEEQAAGVRCEVKVVDDGSRDGTPEAVTEFAAEASLDLELIEQRGRGPAAARNRAMEAVRAPVCLFMNDDSWPRPGLLARHRDFHAKNPETEAALLGAIELPSEPEPTPFMRWLETNHFDYAGIEDPRDAGGERFFTANVSAKMELLLEVGGFEESFTDAANEDVDLGLRLAARGMRLEYDPAAAVEHQHPIDLATAIHRERRTGRALAPLARRHPHLPVPRAPGARHRVKAAALTALTAAGVRTPGVRREVWRFLCHEAAREGYWGELGGERRAPPGGLRIGARLARLAARDPDAGLPAR
jgi:glycosyltransferase involved in cell wall biosynthesis